MRNCATGFDYAETYSSLAPHGETYNQDQSRTSDNFNQYERIFNMGSDNMVILHVGFQEQMDDETLSTPACKADWQ